LFNVTTFDHRKSCQARSSVRVWSKRHSGRHELLMTMRKVSE
jgi:hypothetical protein